MDVWYLRGEGGAVNAMVPPFPEGVGARLRSGAITRVNEDGTPYSEPEATPDAPETPDVPATLAEQRAVKELAEASDRERLPMPASDARKGEWTAYAVSTGRITESAANDLTVRELRERFGTAKG